MPQFSDDVMLGPVPAPTGAGNSSGPALMDLGAGPLARVYIWDVVAATSNVTGVVANAVTVTTAQTVALTPAGAATAGVDLTGAAVVVLDTPRVLTVKSANVGDVTQIVTFSGYDQYWQAMTAQVTMSTTAVTTTLKAFKYVSRVSINTAMTGTIQVGFGDVLGFPYRVPAREYVLANFNALGVVMASITAAATTSPATALTGDVRGLLTLASAADGTKRMVAHQALSAIQCGPNATTAGLYGVTQV